MTRDELNNKYFDWMYRLVHNEKYYRRQSHRKLLAYLHDIEFTYTIGMDGNRAADGVDLRYRFGYEHKLESSSIATYLDDRPCSVLEMLVALAIRCEENIMDDPDIGNRTGYWFWSMIENLRLNTMTDDRFDKRYSENIISKFLNREYDRNGRGGIFIVPSCKNDLRTAEIWYQMCWYLDSIL